MAKKTAKNEILAKLGGDKGWDQEVTRDDLFGNAGLPAGISNGIALLDSCKFDLDKNGNPYFRAVGVVKRPEKHDGSRIYGKHTSIFVPLTERGSDKVSEAAKKRVKVEMTKLCDEAAHCNTLEELMDLADAMGKADIHFRFTTTQSKPSEQYPNPRIWENWNGCCDYSEDDSTDDVELKEEASAKDDEPEQEQGPDLDDLLERAVGDDEGAQAELIDLAIKGGASEEEATSTDTWDEVVEMIRGNYESTNGSPIKGKSYMFKPPRMRKKVKCEVTAVNRDNHSCNMKSEDGTVYKAVDWSKLGDPV